MKAGIALLPPASETPWSLGDGASAVGRQRCGPDRVGESARISANKRHVTDVEGKSRGRPLSQISKSKSGCVVTDSRPASGFASIYHVFV